MPRELSAEPCEVTFDDRISGDKITLYYRMPTTEERVKYANGYVTRKGNQIVSTLGELRMKAGSAVLTGFNTGAFQTDKGLISSKAGEPGYDPAWKAAVKQHASDIVEALAIHVFESSLGRSAQQQTSALDILPANEEVWEETAAPTPAASAEDKDTNPL